MTSARKKYPAFVLIFLPSFLIATKPAPPQQLSIQEAVASALKHRPDLEALTFATQANKSAAKGAIAGYYPTITFNNTLWQEIGQNHPANSALLTANQLLYSFSGPIQNYKRAKKYAEISKLDEDVLTNKIKLEVERTFLQAWFLQQQRVTITALKKSSTETYTKAKHENKLELLDKNVWLTNTEQYASSISNIDQYYDDTITTYKRLEFLMGQSLLLTEGDTSKKVLTKLVWRPLKKSIVHPLATYYNLAINNRPELEQAIKKIDIERYNIQLAQGSRLPTISANASAGHQALVYPSGININRGYHSMGLTVDWTIFDGLVTQYKEQQSEANKVKEILNKEQTVLSIKQEVQDKYFAYSKALTKLKAQKISYVRAHNEFVLRKQELEIGQISPVDFQTAKTNWEQSQLDWYAANVVTELSKRDLWYACGYPEFLQS